MDDLPQRLGLPEADWARIPASVQAVGRALVPVVPVVQDLQLQHQTALARIAALEQEVADVRARLNQHSRNSSTPPSADPPSTPPRPPHVRYVTSDRHRPYLTLDPALHQPHHRYRGHHSHVGRVPSLNTRADPAPVTLVNGYADL